MEISLEKTPSVCCVVLNWNGWRDTVACVRSLLEQEYPALRVLVVDNGSTDGSVERIAEAVPGVEVVSSGGNLGFARGCNVGIRRAYAAGFDYVWMLNNDTVCPPDTCGKLVRKALENPGAGMVGTVLRYMDDPGQVQAWGGGEVNPLLGRSRHFSAPHALGGHGGWHGYLTFASVLIPRQVLERVGVLFEGIFMYWEDSDYALRVTGAGYGLVVAEDTAVLHKEGGSAGPKSATVERYSANGGLWFLERHSPAPWLSMAGFVAVRLGARVMRGQLGNVRAVWMGVREFLRTRGLRYGDRL